MTDSEYAILKLQEVVDDMSQAIAGLAKSLNKTAAMIKCIKGSKQASQFKEDCDQMQQACDAKQKEYDALVAHRNLLRDMLDEYNSSDAQTRQIVAKTILTTFIAFNVIKDGELDRKEA